MGFLDESHYKYSIYSSVGAKFDSSDVKKHFWQLSRLSKPVYQWTETIKLELVAILKNYTGSLTVGTLRNALIFCLRHVTAVITVKTSELKV